MTASVPKIGARPCQIRSGETFQISPLFAFLCRFSPHKWSNRWSNLVVQIQATRRCRCGPGCRGACRGPVAPGSHFTERRSLNDPRLVVHASERRLSLSDWDVTRLSKGD